MLVNLLLLIVINVAMIVIFIVAYSLFKRNPKLDEKVIADLSIKPPKNRKDALISLISSVWIFVIITLIPGTLYLKTKVYIIDKKGEMSTNYLFGSVDYKTSYGEKVTLHTGNYNIIVVNEMKEALVIERVVYGGEFLEDSKTEMLPAKSVSELHTSSIDYGLNEIPPKTLKTWFRKEKFQLRTYKEVQKEYEEYEKLIDELDPE